MPGLAVILGADPDSAHRIDRMHEAIPKIDGDRGHSHHVPEAGASVGWVQRPGSVSGVHNAWNSAGTVGVWLHGEPFAAGRTEASAVVELYERSGDDFVSHLAGWFGGVLVDRKRQRTLVFNDRFGVGRIHAANGPEGLHIATQAQALLRVMPACRRLDDSALAEAFVYGCVLRDRTIFEGISLLPPASLLIADAGGHLERRTYFDRRAWEQQEPLAAAAFDEELRQTFSRVLPRYLAGPGVAMSLTGGLDGRMIMAWADSRGASLPCYSFGGPYRDCHDVRIARAVAQTCGQPHQVIRVDDAMLREFPDLARRCVQVSDGTMDVSGAVELYVNRAARRIAPIRLTGNYGSEIVRSHVAFRPQRLDTAMYRPDFVHHIDAALECYADERRTSDLSFVAFKQVPWYHHARASVERSQLDMRSPFLDDDLVRLMYRAPRTEAKDVGPSLRLIEAGYPELAHMPTDRGVRQGGASAADRIRKAVLNFSAKAEYAYDYGMPRWLSRIDRVLTPLQPERLFLGRHKFYHFRIWYRRELAGYVRDTLLAPEARARAPYREGVLETMVREHTSGSANHTDEIHRALTHELVHQTLIAEAAHG